MKFVSEYTYEQVFNAFLDCRKRKTNKNSTLAFDINREINILNLLEEINSNQYQIGKSIVFTVNKPKPREIWAANFRDRIVHHLVFNEINPYFEKRFIEDSYSCIKGRGVLAASNRVLDFHRKITENYSKDCYYLQIDIKNFFCSIDKNILWNLLNKHIESGKCYDLLYQIIFNDPTQNAIIQENANFSIIPKHKSLWYAQKNIGLPIGNLTSQFFSNVFLNELDQYIKHILKSKYYVRYVDDAIILSKDKDYLLDCYNKIIIFLKNNLHLELHPSKCFIHKASQGITFVGYTIKPYRRFIKKSTINNAKISANTCFSNPNEKSISSINSYLGIIKQVPSYEIRKQLCKTATIPSITTHDNKYTKIKQL